jgi:hypothetical protein
MGSLPSERLITEGYSIGGILPDFRGKTDETRLNQGMDDSPMPYRPGVACVCPQKGGSKCYMGSENAFTNASIGLYISPSMKAPWMGAGLQKIPAFRS